MPHFFVNIPQKSVCCFRMKELISKVMKQTQRFGDPGIDRRSAAFVAVPHRAARTENQEMSFCCRMSSRSF